MNKSKQIDKVMYKLWLTVDEERLMLENFSNLSSLTWSLIKKAYKRGDFSKDKRYSYSKSENSEGTIKFAKAGGKLEK